MTSKQCFALLLVLAAGSVPLGCGDDSDSSNSSGAAAGTSSSDAGMPGTADGGTSNAGASDGGAPSGGGTDAAEAGASSGGAPSTVPDECTDYATTWCSGLLECAPMRIIRDYEDEANCVEVISSRCAIEIERDYPIADLPGCIETLSAGDCQEILSDVSGACKHEHGVKAAGDPCLDNGECESGFCSFSGTTCGECGEVAALGDPCAAGDARCRYPEQVCDFDNDECVALEDLGVGETCNQSEVAQCRPDLLCSESECKERLGEGDDCSLDPNLCDMRRWLFCVADECVQQEVMNLGESCGSEWPFPRCSDYAYCDPESLECVPRHGVNEDCAEDPVAGSSCLLSLTCEDGKCVDVGAACLN